MLAIMHALDEWCHFLEGVVEKFEILMDHWNLAYFCNAQKAQPPAGMLVPLPLALQLLPPPPARAVDW